MDGRRVMVLGGTGFLGTHVCAALGTTDAEVVRVSRKQEDRPGVRSLAIDLVTAEPSEIAKLLDDVRPDAVINCAGAVWQPTEQEMRDANVDLVSRLLTALDELSHRPRLVQMGTVHEYGAGVDGVPIPEAHEPTPVTEYGRTKLLATQAVVQATRTTNLDAVVLRVANSTGPGLPRPSLLGAIAGRLADFARARRDGAADGTELELSLAPLTVRRDFVDIRDVAEAVLAAADVDRPELSGEVVNIGGGQAVRVRDLADRLVGLSAVPVRVVEYQPDGPPRNDVAWQQLDITKARTLLDWRPRYQLEDSLQDMLAAA